MCANPPDGLTAPSPSSSSISKASEINSVEQSLTPAEMGIVDYHRQSVRTGNVGKDERGYPVTVYSNTIEIPEGKDKGKFVTVPGWFNGKMHDDEDVLYNQWKQSIKAGKYPIYDDPKEADNRAKYIHKIMDLEAD